MTIEEGLVAVEDAHGPAPGWRRLGRTVARWLPSLLIAAALIGLWQGLVVLYDIPRWKLIAPSAIAEELWRAKAMLLDHTWVTAQEVFIGFAIALVAGILLAVVMNMSRTLERVIYPSVIASQTIPIIVIAPLLLIWVGYGMQHKVIVVALIAFFPLVVNTVDGLRSADPDLISLLRVMGASRWQVFTKAQAPSSLPFMFSGIKVAITVSVIGAVIGEWVGSNEGLGYLIILSKAQFLWERAYAATVLLGVMGISLFLVVGVLERALLPWYYQGRENRGVDEG